jgi:ribosome modulation factor
MANVYNELEDDGAIGIDRMEEPASLIENDVSENAIFTVNSRMEIAMSITKAFEQGQEAAELSKSKTDCPYPSDSQEGKDWHEGFDDRNDTNDI